MTPIDHCAENILGAYANYQKVWLILCDRTRDHSTRLAAIRAGRASVTLVLSEIPLGMGFGAAASELAHVFKYPNPTGPANGTWSLLQEFRGIPLDFLVLLSD
jgi:hypothetical protein